MTGSLARNSLLKLGDLRILPRVAVVGEFLKPGVPLAFCIASAMALVVSATNLAAGKPSQNVVACCFAASSWLIPVLRKQAHYDHKIDLAK